MATEWRILKRAFSKYEQVATCDSWLIAMQVAEALENDLKDGEYIVRSENEPDAGYPCQGYLEQGVSD